MTAERTGPVEGFDIGRGFSHGLAALQRAILPMLAGGLIMSCTEGGGANFGGDPSSFKDLQNTPGLEGLRDISLHKPEFLAIAAVLLVVVLAVVAAMFALRCWVHAGYIRLQQATIVAGEGSFSELFSGGDILLSIAGWKLLKIAISLGVLAVSGLPGAGLLLAGTMGEATSAPLIAGGVALLLVLTIPAMIYVGIGLSMGELAITLESRGVLEALDRSWSLAQGRRLPLLLFFVVFGFAQMVAAIVGICLLCVGWLITVPAMRSIYETAFTEGFLLITQGQEASQSWAIWSYAGEA